MAAKKKPTEDVVDAAVRAARELRALDVRFAVVGGIAVGARGEPRFTRDVDLAISVKNDSEAERLIFALTKRGYIVDTTISTFILRNLCLRDA